MTVGELKEKLEDVSNDALVKIQTFYINKDMILVSNIDDTKKSFYDDEVNTFIISGYLRKE